MVVIEGMDVVKVILWILQKFPFWNIMQTLMLVVDINSSIIITINIRVKVQSVKNQKKRRRRIRNRIRI